MIHKFSTGPPNDHSCKVTIQLAWWFLTRRFLKFQPMRTHYGPWQPCWISNQHQKHKSGRGPSNEHFWQVWLKSVQRFQRRRFKCEKLTDGRTLTHDKSSHGLWPGELIKAIPDLKRKIIKLIYIVHVVQGFKSASRIHEITVLTRTSGS